MAAGTRRQWAAQSAAAVVALALCAAPARAQDEEPASETADQAPEPAQDEPAQDDAAEEDAAPESKERAPELPPLDPRAQSPEPVPRAELDDPPSRPLEVGPFFGYTLRPAKGDAISYQVAPTWGFYARPQVTPWLGVRLFYRQESIPVSVGRGGFELPEWPLGATDFEQPNLRLRSLGARVEPTWVVNPRLRLSALLGIAWLRFVVPEPVSRGDLKIDTAARSAVELNTTLGASVSFDVIPDWLALSLAVTHGFVHNRSGDAYEPVQAFANGGRLYLGPLPHFRSVTDAVLSLGIVL
jgi:hypothetical protein